MTLNTRVNNEWKKTNNISVKINNSWKKVNKGFVKVDGVWRKFYPNEDEGIVYGVLIDLTNRNPRSAVTYINDSTGFTPAKMNFSTNAFDYGSWADKFPFNQIKPCLFKNGRVNYYLNPNDYTKKVDGSNADITSGNDGDVMIEFPKIYWKFEQINYNLYIRYSNHQVDSSYKCLAFERGSNKRDKVYISAYLGSIVNNKLRSLSGKTPSANEVIDKFRELSHNNGTYYEQMSYYQLLMLQTLYLIMFKDRNSQSALGRGYVNNNSSYANTGTTNKKGLFYGDSTGKQQMKFCGVEDFYGNMFYWIDGVCTDSSVTRNILIGNDNFNSQGTGYKSFNSGLQGTHSGYIGGVQGGTETGFILSDKNGDSTSAYTDRGSLAITAVGHFGGNKESGDGAGTFGLGISLNSTYKDVYISSRLMYL